MQLITITADGTLALPIPSLPSVATEVVEATVQLYRAVGHEPPWVCYLVIEDDACVGMCGFKSPPSADRVEIAYFTFPEHEARGVATRMAAELVRLAAAHLPAVTIVAQTLPEENASTSVLRKLQFRMIGTVEHPDDGLVWEWQRPAFDQG